MPILVVEDDPVMRTVVLHVLGEAGPHVDGAGDVEMLAPTRQALLSPWLMRHVLLPLALIWMLSKGITVASYFTRQADDRALALIANGPGISAAQQQHVMHRWSRGSAGDALREGSGLGLAIVAEYARLLQTGLWLGTAPGGLGLQVALLFDAPTGPAEPANVSPA